MSQLRALALVLLIVLSLASRAVAQTVTIEPTGSIGANGEAVEYLTGGSLARSAPLGGFGSAGIQVTGTFVGTLAFQGSVTCSTYAAIDVTPLGSTTPVQSATSTGAWKADVAGLQCIRVVATAWTSGTAVVTIRGGTGGGAGGSGSAALPTGAATAANQSTAITALQIIDNLPVAQGSTTSGQSNALVAGAVTTSAPSYTTAQTSPLSLTTSGALRTDVANAAAAGTAGSPSTDVISIQGVASGTVVPVAGAILDTIAANTLASQTTLADILSGLSQDATHNATVKANGPQNMSEAKNFDGAPLPNTATEGNAVRNAATLSGVQYTMLVSQNGALQYGTTTTPFIVTTPVADPCSSNAKVYTPISQTANTQLITGTASKKIYICSIYLTSATAESVSLVAGTGATCGTSTVAVIGATSAANGMSLGATGGFTHGNGAAAIAATTVNADNLCLLQSGAVRVAGVMTSVVQ